MTEQTRVLALVGSPRVGGNTDTLVDEVLRGATECGAIADKVYLDRCKIGPCHACDACASSGVCIQRDDMEGLLNRMKESDVWVLATPVYWWGATAQFKLFLDRWYAPWHGTLPRQLFEGRRIVLVVTMGDSDITTADPTIGMFKRVLAYIGLDLAATLVAPGVYASGDASARPELMQQAHDIGQDVSGPNRA